MVKVGILGVGGIAQLSHLPILQDLPELFRIVAISDLSKSLCELVAQRYNIGKIYPRAEELIADPGVEAVMVLSSDPFHCELALKAIEAGKHVFIEKPLAMNSRDVRRLMEAEARRPDLIVMVGYMRRFSPGYLKAVQLLKEYDRPVEYVRFRDIIREGPFYVGQARNPVRAKNLSDMPANAMEKLQKLKFEHHSVALGEKATQMQRNAYQMLLGLGCHSFSAVRELIGPPKAVKSVLTSGNGTHFVALLQYDGFIGTYEMVNDQNVVQFDAAIEIFQGDRKIRIKYETPYIRYLPDYLEVIDSTGSDTRTTIYGPDYHDAFGNELTYFHNCIRDGVRPKTSLADSLEDISLFEKMALMVHSEG